MNLKVGLTQLGLMHTARHLDIFLFMPLTAALLFNLSTLKEEVAKGVPHPYIDRLKDIGHFEQTLPVPEKEHYQIL